MIRARGSCLIRARGSHLIGARGYGSFLIEAKEISNLIGACGSELGRSQSDLIWSDLIGACGSERGKSMLVDRCLIGSCMIEAMDRCL